MNKVDSMTTANESEINSPNSVMDFHPMVWLQSVGQFLNLESERQVDISSEGMKSVRLEVA